MIETTLDAMAAETVTTLDAMVTETVTTVGADVAEKVSKADAFMGLGEGAITALLGYAVVFFGIILLMVVIAIFGKVMYSKKAKAPAVSAAPAPAPAAAPAPAPAAAPAPAPVAPNADLGMKDGHRVCDLYNVDDRTAAMLMAIVADEAGIPLNELRFISIKEL